MPNQNEEFRLLLKSLHLEMKQLADFWGISLRSVQRWAEGSQAVPQARLNTLIEWQRWANEWVKEEAKTGVGKNSLLNFFIYSQDDWARLFPEKNLPTQVHQSAVARVVSKLKQEGYSVAIKRYMS